MATGEWPAELTDGAWYWGQTQRSLAASPGSGPSSNGGASSKREKMTTVTNLSFIIWKLDSIIYTLLIEIADHQNHTNLTE